MAKNRISGTVYWNEEFWGYNRGYRPEVQFDLPDKTTYTVLWFGDGLDNVETPEEAVGIAMRVFADEGIYAEVRISTLLSDEEGSDFEDVTIFAINKSAASMAKFLKNAKTDPGPDEPAAPPSL